MRFFGTEVKSFNLEITNKCTLGCLECPRTKNPWVLKNLTDLPLELIQEIFPLDKSADFAGMKINLCGAHGDCIYHKQFHDVISYLKQVGFHILVETNGSYKTQAWWERSCSILGDGDSVIFSVDGLQDTNPLYRTHSDWNSIMTAMKICGPRVKTNWKFIVFKHNEHQLDEARQLAESLKIHSITFKKSGRFREVDELAPEDTAFIGTTAQNRRKVTEYLDGKCSMAEFDDDVSIRQRCFSGKDIAITARGYLFSCTSCESKDQSSWFNANAEHFNLRQYTVQQVLDSAKWTELEQLWQNASTAPMSCITYCGLHHAYAQSYLDESRPDRPHKPDDTVSYEFT
ncbi:MAG: hypothetical protein GY784_05120 [Gammaproteobacteria bacterium]|nr:hypothetical protein [Gammaproteobacteria bacterium]